MAAKPNPVQNLDYLITAADAAEDNTLDIQKFYKVSMGGTNDSQDEATGTVLEGKKYNSPNFPGFNYDEIFIIPLLIQNKRRVLFNGKYDGSSRPPACWSPDGIQPVTPGETVLGQLVQYCATCSFARFQSNPGCKPRPGIYGLALFHEGGALRTFPVFLDVATTSREAVEALVLALNRGVEINGQVRQLPYYTRIVKCGRQLKQSGGFTVTAWTLRLLGVDSNEVDPQEKKALPNFAPPTILEGIHELIEAAKAQVQTLAAPQISNNAPVGLLPAGMPITAGSVDAIETVTASADDL